MVDKPEMKLEDHLLSVYVDVLNEHGLGSQEDGVIYKVFSQYPEMKDLMDETRLMHQEVNERYQK